MALGARSPLVASAKHDLGWFWSAKYDVSHDRLLQAEETSKLSVGRLAAIVGVGVTVALLLLLLLFSSDADEQMESIQPLTRQCAPMLYKPYASTATWHHFHMFPTQPPCDGVFGPLPCRSVRVSRLKWVSTVLTSVASIIFVKRAAT